MENGNYIFVVVVSLLLSVVSTQPPLSTSLSGDEMNFMVGKCTASIYFNKEHKCAQTFFLSIREDRENVTKCSAKYIKLRACMLNAFENCLRGSQVETFLANQRDVVVQNFVTLIGTEERWCKHGGLGIPEYLYKGTTCHPIYAYTARDCVSRYQNVFNSPSSYTRLCREYNQARTCLFRNLITHCSFSNRPLRQMMALLIEVQYDYQPYCQQSLTNTPTYEELLNNDNCPSYAHADVIFAIDSSKETTIQEFLFMKMLISRVAIRLNYEMSGIRIAVEQYNENTVTNVEMDGYDTKRSFLRALKRSRQINSDKNGGRLTGKTLMNLAETQLNLGEPSSVIRPFHTPILVVLTTGKSADESEQEAVRTLNDRGVHVVRFGPSYKTNRVGNDATYHVNNTMNYTAHFQSIIDEICLADRMYREQSLVPVIEGYIPEERRSLLATIREHIFSRLPGVQLSLLWEPDAVEFIPFTVSNNNNIDSEEGGLAPINPFENPYFPGLEPEFPEVDFGDGISEEVSEPWRRFR